MASGEHRDTGQKAKPSGKKAVRVSQKEQSERFRQTARTIGADDVEAFEKVFGALVTTKKPSA